ncbi:hypothetical protein [Fluviispira vulneris]|uniref:hypothetical protein n=1 Tax=Fluviispira vulneris TaxID=2763012 RepID=UPI001644872D|nr:hypothetical protein [Fluviispira vulneris]
MATHNKILPDERLQRSQVDTLALRFKITGKNKAVQCDGFGAPVIFGFTSADLSQSEVDKFCGEAGDVQCNNTFGTVALAANAFAFCLLHGSARRVLGVKFTQIGASGNVDYVEGLNKKAPLPNTATNGAVITGKNHIVGRYVDSTGKLSTLESGFIHVDIEYEQL